MVPWLALVLLDTITVATFARCFTGPGELAYAIPVCIGAHVAARLARLVAQRGHRYYSLLTWALAIVLVALVPVLLVEGTLPIGHAREVLGSQLHLAWHVFSYKVSPVAQVPGLVLAGAWAAGVLALAAEALDADTTLPAIVALVPAFDIVMFTGTLGTSTGRAPELAALAACAVLYLTGTQRRAGNEQVVTARLEGAVGSAEMVRAAPQRGRPRLGSRFNVPVPGLVAVAALAAGVIGPLAPGSNTTAVVAWHGSDKGDSSNAANNGSGAANGPITVSNLVQVGPIEFHNKNTQLFQVTAADKTREILVVLDRFNGDQWTALSQGITSRVEQFNGSIGSLETHPIPEIVGRDGGVVTQVIKDIDLGGSELPVPGAVVVGVDGFPEVLRQGTDGPLTSSDPISNGTVYAVQADIAPPAEVAQEFFDPKVPLPAVDLFLPDGVPPRVRALAQQIVAGATTFEEKAIDIENYFLDNFKYNLPSSVSANQSVGYTELEDFLQRRVGYCQQFASAFAVFARIDGLPTRIAVGFLPSASKGDTWTVTGVEVHAWPQVYFPGTGWVDFEPTPGASIPPTAPIKPTTTTTVGGGGTTPSSLPTGPGGTSPPCRSCQPPKGAPGTTLPFTFPTIPGNGGGGSVSHHNRASGAPMDLLLGLVVAAGVWIAFVPLARLLRTRRQRDPVRAVLLAWHNALFALAAAGLHRRRAETFDEFARRVRLAGILSTEATVALERLVTTTDRVYFDRSGPSAAEAYAAASDARAVQKSAHKSVSRWLLFILQFDPRDLIGTPSQ